MAIRALDTLITQSFPTGVDLNTQSNGNGGGGAGEEGKFLLASAGNDNMVLDTKTNTHRHFIFQEPIKLTTNSDFALPVVLYCFVNLIVACILTRWSHSIERCLFAPQSTGDHLGWGPVCGAALSAGPLRECGRGETL